MLTKPKLDLLKLPQRVIQRGGHRVPCICAEDIALYIRNNCSLTPLIFKYLFFLFVVIGCLYINPVIAERYFIDKGKGLKICKLYKKGVETALLNEAARCERKFSSKFADLNNPKWEIINLWENKELFKKIYKFTKSGNINKYHSVLDNESEYNKMLELWIKNKSMSLKISKVDIDNDNNIDTILMVTEGACEISAKAPYYSNLVVLKNMQTIDEEKTINLDQNILYDKQTNQWMEAKFNINYMQYDVFKYMDTVYFDKSDIRNKNGLTVYKYEKNEVIEICHMKLL